MLKKRACVTYVYSAKKPRFFACESLLRLNRSFTSDWGINNNYFTSSGRVIFRLVNADGVVNIGFFNNSLVVYVNFSFALNNSISVAKGERNRKYPDMYQVMIPCNYTINSISKITHSNLLRHFIHFVYWIIARPWRFLEIISVVLSWQVSF